ncbi:MAG TPA: tRNA guanosine(34) transglycosylase Tgt [Spirochaetota bacterium]|nr:tRNA guanosine(34) transglycosylase Tgt [Spirochaetota bacterium]
MNIENTSRLKFRVEAEQENSKARACTFTTLHNTVQTPVFMPVATLAVLRSQDTTSVEELGFPVLLANTYHLLLRPGTEVFRKFGGIHQFMNWKRSVLTDSGGFQVFSLSKDVKITEDGAVFRSYHDGKKIVLSPETSIQTQKIINSDIMMAMDQCIPSTSEESLCRNAADITARWAERSIAARGDSPQSIFGIVQGACFPELRKISARQITSLPFDGFAIGGLAVGESENERKDMTEMTASLLPGNYPRYLMGVGTPIDILEAVHRGVDMFDCILPTAMAQQGVAYTSHGRMELRRGIYKFQDRPLDENCSCTACTRYSRAYLHHLTKTSEYYGGNLIGIHNLTFYRNLMDSMRGHILNGTFSSYYSQQKERLVRDDDEHPVTPPKSKKKNNLPSLGDYEIIKQDAGFHSIRHVKSGEIMHSVTDPVVEAKDLYISQSKIPVMLKQIPDNELVIWDVGLGAGTNAMAAVFECEKILGGNDFQKGVKIISFERDLDSLRLAVKNPSLFHHVRHPAPASILRNGSWKSDSYKIEWILMEGDFLDHMEKSEQPHCIFYDPFSLNTDGPLWSYKVFNRIYNHCINRPAKLFTYSSSTMVRGALLAAGFYTGTGAGTGPKAATTAAFTSLEAVNSDVMLLGSDWLRRFHLSSSKFGSEHSEEEKALIEKLIINHPQFNKTSGDDHNGN